MNWAVLLTPKGLLLLGIVLTCVALAVFELFELRDLYRWRRGLDARGKETGIVTRFWRWVMYVLRLAVGDGTWYYGIDKSHSLSGPVLPRPRPHVDRKCR